jgi:hypothetical protein
MSTAELKLDLINKISEMKEVGIIKEIKKLIDFELNEDIFELNQLQIDRITEAKEEYSNGKILSEKQANSDIEKWLNEK